MINVLSKTTLVRCCCKDAIKTLKKSSAIQIVARTKMNVTSSIDEENIFRPIIGMTGNEGILHLLLYSSGRSMRHWFCLPKSLRNNCHHAALKRKFTTNSLMGTDNDESDLLSDSFCPAEKKPLQLFSAIDRDYMSIDDVTQILNESLCEDLCVIKIDEEKTKFHYVDYFVIVSGRSVRHLKSMAFEVCAKFKQNVREKRGKATAIVEGEDCNDWMVVDIGNVVVHFMTPEARERYELEKLWTLGPVFDDQLQQMAEKEREFEIEDLNLPFKSKLTSGKKLVRELSTDSSR